MEEYSKFLFHHNNPDRHLPVFYKGETETDIKHLNLGKRKLSQDLINSPPKSNVAVGYKVGNTFPGPLNIVQ